LKKTSSILLNCLNTIPDNHIANINLGINQKLATGYESGHICGFYYDKNDFPSNKTLIEDFNKIFRVYEELISMMKGRSIDQFNNDLLLEEDGKFFDNDLQEIDFQDRVTEESSNKNKLNYDSEEGPEERDKPNTDPKGSKRWPRSALRAAQAIIESDYRCSVDSSHQTFISGITKKNYVEAHHLIPMKWQIHIGNKIDRVSNILSLCPNCHRLVHHGEDEVRRKIILDLFHARRERLVKLGIEITEEDLLFAYGI
jgi:5-methylcytosine-specific restriction protein A